MKISITGQTGFVGQNLIKYFTEKGYFLTNLPRNFLSEEAKTELENSDVIIHLAGKAHDLKETSNSWQYFEVNTLTTQRIYDIFLQSKASVFIYFSSVKAVADQLEEILTEETKANPKTDYGRSKHWAEEYVLSKETTKRVYILRPCLIYGPGYKGNLKLLNHFAHKNFPWPLGNFQNQRSIISIQNICFIISELLSNSHIHSGIYNLADDTPLSTNEIFTIFAEATGKKAKIIKINKKLIRIIASIGNCLG